LHQCGGGSGGSQSHQDCVHPSTACLEAMVAQKAVAAVADTAGATTTMPYAKAGVKEQVSLLPISEFHYNLLGIWE
jgi:hypothetical protein